MAGMPKFDPWLALKKMGLGPAAIAATAANRPSAASAAGGQDANRKPNPTLLADLPASWRDALELIEVTRCPAGISADRWNQTVVDARYLVSEWGRALYATGWELADLFGAHRRKPLDRYDCMGLCLLLQGRKVGPILADRIAIHTGPGIQHFRRFHAPAAETVNLWNLESQ